MLLPDFDGVLFDMDGTLINTEALYMEEWRRAASCQGFELTDALWHRLLGRPTQECLVEIKNELGVGFNIEEHVAEWRPRLAERLANEIPVMAGARDLITYLQQNAVKITVVTSASRVSAETYLTTAKLRHHFDQIITWDDVTNGKPDSEPFRAGAALLGLPPERCLAIEDTEAGIRSAHGAGAIPIMVPSLKQPDAAIEKLCHIKCTTLVDVHRHIDDSLRQRGA